MAERHGNNTLATPDRDPDTAPALDVVARAWATALECDEVDLDAGFADLGADSVIVVAVVTQLRSRWPELSLADVFAYPTVRSLAERLEADAGSI